MYDIKFYEQVHGLKMDLMDGKSFDKRDLFDRLESFRNPDPVVYNIETTSNCNMRCTMCPRTTEMTRPPSETLSDDNFKGVVDQLRPWASEEWGNWENFVEGAYGIKPEDMSENHYFLHVIPKVIQLHGYGAPLLDKQLEDRVSYLTENGFDSYFSCNPSNIGIRGIEVDFEIMERGLTYIKYSVESTDDEVHRAIRGDQSNFQESYENILRVLEEKEKRGLETTVVITMLDLNRPNQQEDWEKLKEHFKGKDVYIYFKSEDQQWYKEKHGGKKHGTKSVHWTESCQFPWSSMTIKSDGKIAMCVEDYNNEIIFGDSRTESLRDIWNGPKYDQFRRDHLLMPDGNMKCTGRCDMALAGENSTGELDSKDAGLTYENNDRTQNPDGKDIYGKEALQILQ